jgi:hypothetical protein
MRTKFIILTVQAITAATLIGLGAGLGLMPCIIVGVIILGTMIITTLSNSQPKPLVKRPVQVLNPARVLV